MRSSGVRNGASASCSVCASSQTCSCKTCCALPQSLKNACVLGDLPCPLRHGVVLTLVVHDCESWGLDSTRESVGHEAVCRLLAHSVRALGRPRTAAPSERAKRPGFRRHSAGRRWQSLRSQALRLGSRLGSSRAVSWRARCLCCTDSTGQQRVASSRAGLGCVDLLGHSSIRCLRCFASTPFVPHLPLLLLWLLLLLRLTLSLVTVRCLAGMLVAEAL